MWAAAWPMLAAVAILLPLRARPSLSKVLRRIRIPAGDVVVPLTLVTVLCGRIWHALTVAGLAALIHRTSRRSRTIVARSARYLLDCLARGVENDLTAGLLIGLLAVVLFALIRQ